MVSKMTPIVQFCDCSTVTAFKQISLVLVINGSLG